MALNYSHGAFQWTTGIAGTTYTVSGLSFQPKALKFYTNGINSVSDAVSQLIHSRRSMGFATSTTNRAVVTTKDEDNPATMICATAYRTDSIVAAISVGTTAAIDGLLDLNSITSDGFQVIVDDAVTSGLTVFWEAWGGTSLTDAVVGSILEPAGAGDQVVTTSGTNLFQPNAIMFAGVQATAAAPTVARQDSGFSHGFSTGIESAHNVVIQGNSDDGSSNSDTDGYGRTGDCIAMVVVAGGTTGSRATVSALSGTGFTLTWAGTPVTDRKHIFLAIKGGSWEAGGYTIAGNSANSIATVSGLNFMPVGISLIGKSATENAAGAFVAEDKISIGCGTSSTSRRTMGHWSENSTANGEIDLTLQYDQILAFPGATGTLVTAYDIDSIFSNGFIIITDTAGGVANEWQGYLAFGTPPTTQTQTGVANLLATVTTQKTQNGVADINARVIKTQSGVSRIQKTVTAPTQPGKSFIQIRATKTQEGLSCIRATSTKTQEGIAHIHPTAMPVRARVSWVQFEVPEKQTVTTTKTQSGISRIQKNANQKTQSGISRIQKNANQQTRTGVTSIIRPRIRVSGVSLGIPAAPAIVTTTKTQTGISRIRKTAQQTQAGVSRIRVATTKTLTGTANIAVTGTVSKTQTGISRIRKTAQQTQAGVSRIQKTVPTIYRDNFNRPDVDPLPAPWMAWSPAYDQLRNYNNRAGGPDAVSDNASVYSALNNTAQYVQAKIYYSGSLDAAIWCFAQTGLNVNDCYHLTFDSGLARFYKIVNDSWYYLSVDVIWSLSSGDTIKLTAEPEGLYTRLRLYLNGVPVGTYLDNGAIQGTILTSGYPGLDITGQAGEWDDFEAGELFPSSSQQGKASILKRFTQTQQGVANIASAVVPVRAEVSWAKLEVPIGAEVPPVTTQKTQSGIARIQRTVRAKVQDNFNRANTNDLTMSGLWVAAGSGRMGIIDNVAVSTSSDRGYIYYTGAYSPAQYSQAKINSLWGGRLIGLVVRASSGGAIGLEWDTADYYTLYVTYSGVRTPYYNGSTAGWAVNDIIRLEIDAYGAITVKRNGSVIRTDTEPLLCPMGAPGIMGTLGNETDASIDDWEGGELPSAPELTGKARIQKTVTYASHDDFNRGSLGSNWTQIADSNSHDRNIIIVNNEAARTPDFYNMAAIYNFGQASRAASGLSLNQFAQARVVTTPVSDGPAVIVRGSPNATAANMGRWYNFSGNSDGCGITRFHNGSWQETIAIGGTIVAWHAGDIVRLEVEGSGDTVYLRGYINGTLVLSGTSTGVDRIIEDEDGFCNPGVGFEGTNGAATLDDFYSGNLPYNSLTGVTRIQKTVRPRVKDDFNRPDEVAISGMWTTGIWDGFSIINQQAGCSVNLLDHTSYYNGASFTPDQYSKATISAVTDHDAAIVVRASGKDATYQGYGFYIWPQYSVASLRRMSGPWGSDVIADQATGVHPTVGDIMELRVVGNVLTGYLNGALIITGTDSNYTSGSPGLMVRAVTDAWDNFEAGEIPVAPEQQGKARIQVTQAKTQTGVANIAVTGTVQKTITGLADVRKTTQRTQTGSARIQLVGVAKPQLGTSRVRTTVTKLQTGVSRILQRISRTQAGISDIRKSTQQAQTGVARIRKTVTQTQLGLSAIRKTTQRTQTGVARIGLVTPRTQLGISRIQVTTQKTQTGVSRLVVTGSAQQQQLGISDIRKTTQRTQTGAARIQIAGIAKTQTGISRVQITNTKLQTGTSRILQRVYKTQSGTSRIGLITSKTQVGTSRIQVTTQKTQTGVSRLVVTGSAQQQQLGISDIRKTTQRTQTGAARVQLANVTKSQTGVARVQVTTQRTQTGVARVQQRVSRTQLGIAAILRTVQKTQAGISRIGLVTPKTQTGSSRIQVTTQRTQTGVARMVVIGVTQQLQLGKAAVRNTTQRTQLGVGRIGLTTTKLQPGIARVQITTQKSQSGTARIRQTILKTQTGTARVRVTAQKTQVGISQIRQSVVKTQTGISRIQVTTQRTLTGVARMVVIGVTQQQQLGKADIRKTTQQTQTGVARIQLVNVTKTQTGSARIQVTTQRTQTGISRIRVTAQKTQLGTGRIGLITSKTQTGSARIQVTAQRTQTGVARMVVIGVSQQYQSGKAAIRNTTQRVQTGTGRIGLITQKTQTGRARIQISTPRTQTGVARIRVTTAQVQSGLGQIRVHVTKTQTGRGSVIITYTKTQTGMARIRVTSTQAQLGKAAIRVNANQKALTGVSRIQVTATVKTRAGISRIQISTQKTQLGTGRIRVTTQATQLGTARIQVTAGQKTLSGISRILFSRIYTQTGISDIRKAAQRNLLGGARIQITNSAQMVGIGFVVSPGSSVIFGRARISNVAIQTQSGLARIKASPVYPKVPVPKANTGKVYQGNVDNRTIKWGTAEELKVYPDATRV